MDVSTLKVMDKVDTGAGPEMTVVGLSYGVVPVESVLDGSAKPVEATLTSDGRTYWQGWHKPEADGPFSDDSAYVERWDATGRAFHGYVDSVSRKLTQTG